MLKKDNFWLGLVIGIIVPIVGYALWLTFFEQSKPPPLLADENLNNNFSERTTLLMAIAGNVIPLMLYNKLKCINTMRGVILPTAIGAMVWFILYGRHLIG